MHIIILVYKGQLEAARALGMPYSLAMKEVVIPQAIKNILPTLLSEFIVLLKEISIVGSLGASIYSVPLILLQAKHIEGLNLF